MFNEAVDADLFAIALDEILEDTMDNVKRSTAKAVGQSARKGAKTTRQKARGAGGKHGWSAEYTEGFSSHVEDHGDWATGEIGNKNKPGLVHLLEKGHATLNGRKTTAYPHIGPAYQEIEKDFRNRIGAAVDEGLGA